MKEGRGLKEGRGVKEGRKLKWNDGLDIWFGKLSTE